MVDQLLNSVITSLREKVLGGRWNVVDFITIKDPNDKWTLEVVKKKDCYPLIGPENKETSVETYAIDTNGDLHFESFSTRSLSWIRNNNEIFPLINAWIFIITNTDPNLQGV